MKKIEIQFKDLREAVNALNESGLLKDKIRLVGFSKDEILKNYMDAVDAIPDDANGKFPGPIIVRDFYNKMFDDELAKIEAAKKTKGNKKK